MSFFPAELIKKKRNGGVFTGDEIRFVIESFTRGELPEYQMSAWLMTVYFKGMNAEETATLTEAMLRSGRRLDFSHLPSLAVDKHSTGGVGDKTSMILAPIAAAAGAYVPMIAGRGLGHTGGTLDKLEAIPGFRIGLTLDEFAQQVEKKRLSIIGQTAEICPADKKIYALRDVTATIESLPLICASIMSKKLAEGIGALVLDVKYGNGAFMKTLEDADTLADKLMEIGTAHGKKVAAILTNMDQPLGRFIGNSLEMAECYAILQGKSYRGWSADDFADTRDLSVELAGYMIWLSGVAKNAEDGIARAKQALESGKAWETFVDVCRAQGGNPEALPEPKESHEVRAAQGGFVFQFDTEKLGLAAIALGAGRLKTTDQIDHQAGIEVHRKLGEEVKAGDLLFTLYSGATSTSASKSFAVAEDMVLSGTTISLQKPKVPDLIVRRKVN